MNNLWKCKKRRVISLMMVTILMTCAFTPSFASASSDSECTTRYYDDNGNLMDENSDLNVQQTMDEDQLEINQSTQAGPIIKSFKSYTVTKRAKIDRYKKICEVETDNRTQHNTKLICSITKSSQSTSTWSVNLSSEIKGKILAQVGAKYTASKKVNAAVGLKETITVPPGKKGNIKAFYRGHKTSGYIKYNLIQNNKIIGEAKEKTYTTQTNHYKELNVYFATGTW